MANIALEEPRPLPTWLKVAVSVGVIAHFVAIGGVILSAPSGPWMPGTPPVHGPLFAAPIEQAATPYLTATRMTHTYRFVVDRPKPAVYFEVHLKDARGDHLKTLKFPDPKANPWVRHRQQLLADALFGDNQTPPPQGEVIAPRAQKAPMRTIWEPLDKQMVLKTIPEHLLPRDRPMILSPSEWSLLTAKSYARHLCRVHDASAAEIVRHSRDIVLPPTLLPPPLPGQERAEPPPALFEELVFNFGVHRLEE